MHRKRTAGDRPRYAGRVIRLACDNCDQVLEVPESAAGQKIKCPACGDVRLVPRGKPPGEDDKAAAAGYPPANGPEQRVLLIRKSMFRARPFLFLLVLLLVLGGGGLAAYAWTVNPPRPALTWAGLAAAILGLLCLVVWKVSTLNQSLEITNKRTIERKGLFSRFTSEVRHQDIRNIQVTQSFFDRVMSVGRIGISSAGQDDVEIVADDVPSPDRVREIIDLYRVL
jgi:hypothetical protein